MIEEIQVERFKAFEELHVPRVSRLTLVGGENGVGKTCLLEAVFAFFDRLNPGVTIRQFPWRGVTTHKMTPDQILGPFFYNYDLSNGLSVRLKVDGSWEEVGFFYEPDYRPGASAVTPRPEDEELARSSKSTAGAPALRMRYTSGNGEAQEAHVVLSDEGPKGAEVAAEKDARVAHLVTTKAVDITQADAWNYGELDVQKRQEAVLDFAREFDGRIRSLSSVAMGQQTVLHADIGLSRKIPVGFLGSGITRLLHMYLIIASHPKAVILIDEIDKGIHYSKLEMIWRGLAQAVNEYDCQLIATTHSWECLAAAASGLNGLYDPDFTYVRLEAGRGCIKANVFPFENFAAAIEREWELR